MLFCAGSHEMPGLSQAPLRTSSPPASFAPQRKRLHRRRPDRHTTHLIVDDFEVSPSGRRGTASPPRCRIRCWGGRADANSVRGGVHSFRRTGCCPARLQGPKGRLGASPRGPRCPRSGRHHEQKKFFCSGGSVFLLIKTENFVFFQRSFLSTPHPSYASGSAGAGAHSRYRGGGHSRNRGRAGGNKAVPCFRMQMLRLRLGRCGGALPKSRPRRTKTGENCEWQACGQKRGARDDICPGWFCLTSLLDSQL
jgi:hypothetical protein